MTCPSSIRISRPGPRRNESVPESKRDAICAQQAPAIRTPAIFRMNLGMRTAENVLKKRRAPPPRKLKSSVTSCSSPAARIHLESRRQCVRVATFDAATILILVNCLLRYSLIALAASLFTACSTVNDLVVSNIPSFKEGKTSVVVDLSNQEAYLLKRGEEVAASRISFEKG
jgi:hypothetical protein